MRLLYFLIATTLVGCASYKPQAVNVMPAQNYVNRVSGSSLIIAVDPYDTEEKSKSAFYADLTKKNIKPVHLIIENTSLNNFLLTRRSIVLKSQHTTYHPVDGSYVFNQFEKNELLYAFFGFGIFSYMSAEKANKKMQADWYSKELPENVTLTKKRKVSGFVFFETPEHLSGKTVVVRLLDLKSDEEVEVEVPIH